MTGVSIMPALLVCTSSMVKATLYWRCLQQWMATTPSSTSSGKIHIIIPADIPESSDGPTVSASKEWPDSCKVGGDYYLSHEKVDEWAKESLAKLAPFPVDPAVDKDKSNYCEEWWSNMLNEVTAQMWGIFDETGIFLALSHHGFVLVVANMVQSGEL